jgi:hypothetical protein
VAQVEFWGRSQLFWQPLPQKSMVVPQFPYSLQQTLRGHVSLPGAALRPHSVVVIEALASRGERNRPVFLGQSRSNARAGPQRRRPKPRDLSEVNMLCWEAKLMLICVTGIGWFQKKCRCIGKQGKTRKDLNLYPQGMSLLQWSKWEKHCFDCREIGQRCNKYSLPFAYPRATTQSSCRKQQYAAIAR